MKTSGEASFHQDEVVKAVAEVARRWREPDHGPREAAVEKTLEAPNRFTEEALAFAINQQMAELSEENLRAWVEGRAATRPLLVGLLYAGNVPLAGLQDFLAVILTGHRHLGSLSSKSPYLVPAFASELEEKAGLFVQFGEAERVFSEAEAIIATGTDETREWARAECERRGIVPERRLLRGHRYSVAVVDGEESEEEREGLAEDMLLHEGLGCRNVAVVWAPEGLEPDAYLEAMAHFRGVFPAHDETPGTITMQQAMLEAVDQPHAYGEGLEFLLSKGEPEPQSPGHIRWVEYSAFEDVERWLQEEKGRLQVVVAREELSVRLPEHPPRVAPGQAQRPELDWRADGKDTVAFLSSL